MRLPLSPATGLLGQSGVESLVQLVRVVGPELEAVEQRVLEVLRRRRHVRLQVDAGLGMGRDQRHRRLPHRAVRDVPGLVGVALGVGGVLDEVQRQLQLLGALDDAIEVEVPDLPVPDDDEGLLLQVLGVEDAAVIDGLGGGPARPVGRDESGED